MKLIAQSVTIAVLLTLSAYSLAAGSGWTVASEVVQVVVVSTGGVNVRLSPELTGCSSQSGYGAKYASVYPTHGGIDAMQANLLTANPSGSEVKLYLVDP